MKPWLLPILAVVAGTVIGASTALVKYEDPQLILSGHQSAKENPAAEIKTPLPVADAKPRVFLPDPLEFHFGRMERSETKRHSFKVQNIGNGPLTLKVLDTTCKCTVGELGSDNVKAGEIADVTLEWTALSYQAEFRQSATIETNDQIQREIVFSVVGQVIQSVMPYPTEFKISRLSRSVSKEVTSDIYAYKHNDFMITSHGFSESEYADLFTVDVKPIPEEEWLDERAKSAVRVTIGIKPGLPIGVVRQIITLDTNKEEVAPIEILMDMTVISDISLLALGGKFNDESNVLTLGPVPKSEGKTVNMLMMVKGQYRDQVDFSVDSIYPEEALQVEIGEPTSLNNGTVRRFPLKVEVKRDSPNVYCMGSDQGKVGSVVFKTNHPEIEEFKLRVVFAVQD